MLKYSYATVIFFVLKQIQVCRKNDLKIKTTGFTPLGKSCLTLAPDCSLISLRAKKEKSDKLILKNTNMQRVYDFVFDEGNCKHSIVTGYKFSTRFQSAVHFPEPCIESKQIRTVTKQFPVLTEILLQSNRSIQLIKVDFYT